VGCLGARPTNTRLVEITVDVSGVGLGAGPRLDECWEKLRNLALLLDTKGKGWVMYIVNKAEDMCFDY
jgi:hypothetical protein